MCSRRGTRLGASAFGRDHESEGAGGAGPHFEKTAPLDTPVTDDAGVIGKSERRSFCESSAASSVTGVSGRGLLEMRDQLRQRLRIHDRAES